jgi:hypothetical protein
MMARTACVPSIPLTVLVLPYYLGAVLRSAERPDRA